MKYVVKIVKIPESPLYLAYFEGEFYDTKDIKLAFRFSSKKEIDGRLRFPHEIIEVDE